MDSQQDTFLITLNDNAQWKDDDQVDVEDGSGIISENSPDEAVWQNMKQITSENTLRSDELEATDTNDNQQVQLKYHLFDPARKNFIHYLADETETIGLDAKKSHGPNAVISMVNYY
ncbi:hypothetical protein RvY_08264 [Ramazzottius varieornatus]|uniref:Uncharacterized protein n=1 Tax=Ramazzottius varieornatus TaxID=947166 RepID=A0A1D1VDE5_RAMVA|nr:hypothetical protein RvY_08264 [Ramazzottius varieornatus]